MKRYFNSIGQTVAVAWFLVAGASCSDTWKDHYSTDTDFVSKNSIASVLESHKDEYSNFLEALSTTYMYNANKQVPVTFYQLLASDQFITVWAPKNDALTDTEWKQYTKPDKTAKENELAAQRFIMNHIARFNHSTFDGNYERVLMLSNKNITCADNKINGVPFNGDNFNLVCSNGVLHLLDGKVDYVPNIYEFITTDDRYAGLFGEWFESFTEEKLDEQRSVAGEINEESQIVYIDSVTYKTSLLMNTFGMIDAEDSNYVVILPSPEVWEEYYEKVEPMFIYDPVSIKHDYDDPDVALDSLRLLYTNAFLLSDRFVNMNLQKNDGKDSLTSTQYVKVSNNETDPYALEYHKFRHPFDEGGILYGAEEIECSNGKVFITEDWGIDPKLSFLAPSKYEADVLAYDQQPDPPKGQGTSGVNVNSYYQRTTPQNPVSESYLLRITPSEPTITWKVTFTVPDTRAGKFKLKLVVIADTDSKLPYYIHPKVMYGETLALAEKNGVLVDEKSGRVTKPYSNNIENLTDTITVDDIVELPYSNYGESKGRLFIEISNQVKGSNVEKYSADVKIDQIILEPIEE